MKTNGKCLRIITLHIKGGGSTAHRHSHITTICVIFDPVLMNPKQTPEQL